MAKKLNFNKQFIYNPLPAVAQGAVKLYKQEDEGIEGNPLYSHHSVDTLLCTIISLNSLCRLFKIRSEGISTLFIVYQYYKLHGYGCGVWDVVKKYGLGSNHCTLIKDRLALFAKRGLVDCVGTGINNRKLYMPTNYTIKEIEKFMG